MGKRRRPCPQEQGEEDPSSTWCGFVQTCETTPTQRRCAGVQSHGFQRPQPLTLLSEGADTVRHLPCDLRPEAEHI